MCSTLAFLCILPLNTLMCGEWGKGEFLLFADITSIFLEQLFSMNVKTTTTTHCCPKYVKSDLKNTIRLLEYFTFLAFDKNKLYMRRGFNYLGFAPQPTIWHHPIINSRTPKQLPPFSPRSLRKTWSNTQIIVPHIPNTFST